MTPNPEEEFTGASRRKFILTAGVVGATGIAGCAGSSGGNGGDNATTTKTNSNGAQTEAAKQDQNESESTTGGAEPKTLTAEGSSTVYPIANTAASYWNSNPPADDKEYWGPGQYNIDTDKRLADYWASLYGFEPTGEVANPPFSVQVGLSHSGTGVKALMNQQVDIGDSSAPVPPWVHPRSRRRRPPDPTRRRRRVAGRCWFSSPQETWRRPIVSDGTGEHDPDSSELSPEQRLDPPNARLINAGIATINDMETLRACVAYENAHQQRVQILRWLEDRANELRSQDD